MIYRYKAGSTHIFILGVCSCYDGYISDDCSEAISKPPFNITLPSMGLCGTRSRACKRTNVYGTFKSKIVWCRRRHFQVITSVDFSKSDNHSFNGR